MVRVDLRIQVIEIPSQDVISRDNVSMKVDAVLNFRVVDPKCVIIQLRGRPIQKTKKRSSIPMVAPKLKLATLSLLPNPVKNGGWGRSNLSIG